MEHPATATVYDNLAMTQKAQGKYREAETGCRKALEIFRKVLGEEHPDTAIAYSNMAFNQQAQGKIAEAEGDFRKALEINRKVQGEEHPATASVSTATWPRHSTPKASMERPKPSSSKPQTWPKVCDSSWQPRTSNAASPRAIPSSESLCQQYWHAMASRAGVELRKGEDLVLEAAGPQGRPRVAIRIWRLEDEGGKPQARQLDLTVAPGPLGVVVAKELAPQALTYRRKIEEEMVAKRAEALRELPGTRYEVKRLEKLFKSKQQSAEVLLDEQASLASLQERARDGKLFRCRYLHLATHGQSDGGNGLHSRLLLARDGELSAEEILRQWHLQADLVTLSACKTALGERASGERHIGFAQPLLLAGARSMVLSLWKVDDSATALLMERFYENLLGQREGLKQPLGKAPALAEARDWLRRLPREEA